MRDWRTAEGPAPGDFLDEIFHVVVCVEVDRGSNDGRVEIRCLVSLELGHVENRMDAF